MAAVFSGSGSCYYNFIPAETKGDGLSDIIQPVMEKTAEK